MSNSRILVAVLLASTATVPALAQTPLATATPAQAAPPSSITPADQGDVSTQAQPATDSTEIVVTGLRRSLETSANIKRNSLEVVDSITADDIGKLPDPNVAETLSRIPGVQAYRFGGEASSPVGNGSGLTIRGLSGQTASRVDGRAYFTAGGREFNIEGASPGMVAGVDVFKNPSAEHIEGGIGGLVNIRTRKPFDFRGFALSASTGLRYNDLADKAKPEFFGLVSDRWSVGDGEMGFLIAGSFSKTFNRSDNNPANGGTSLRRAVRADSAEYAGNAALNRSLAGRSDVTYLADVANPLALSAADRANLISTVAESANINQEDIQRTRKGLNAAFQWKPSSTFQFYAEGTYNYYLYHQDYRFLNSADSRYVQNLTTAPFTINESLANRNANGGADEILSGQRLTSGTFLNSGFTTTGGDEHRRYKTFILASGFKWSPAEKLDVNLDVSYVKANQYQDNRSVVLSSQSGLAWDIKRDLTKAPQQIAITGPDLGSAGTWVFNNYSNGTNQTFTDDGVAVALDLKYEINSFFKDVKFGGRYATQNDSYRNYSYSGRNLTSNGLPLAADRSNAIGASAFPLLTQASPTNWLDGSAGYSGGYLVFGPEKLLGDTVKDAFPQAGIPANGSLPEVLLNRRLFREKTYAGYALTDFSGFDDRIRGNLGVRVVRTETYTQAQVASVPAGGGPATVIPNERNSSYTNVLPTFNITGSLTPDTLVRFGYGKGITRPDLGSLNPTIIVDTTSGTGSVGNPDLRPQKADSYDLSIEHYFSSVNYASVGLFYKKIDGFFSGIEQCQTIGTVPPFSGVVNNNCASGQYRVTQTINATSGTAKGVELAVQTFFDYDFMPDIVHPLGVSASFTYVDASNPLTLNGVVVDTQQPFTSKYNWTTSAFYEDKVLSARIVYTHRSEAVLFGISPNPIDGRYIGSFGLLDASIGVKLPHNLSLSITASNLTNASANRYVGEPGLATGIERQHFVNGRNFGATLRYNIGS